MSHEFDATTAVTRVAEGRWGARIDEGWFSPVGANGGYVASIVLRAMAEAVADPERAPRTLTLHYLRPPAAGPAEVVVSVERTGRSLTSLTARLEQDGRVCVLALAAFAVDMPSGVDYADAMPASTAFADTPPTVLPAAAPPISHRLDIRRTIGPKPFTLGDEGRTGGWLQFTEPRPTDALACATYLDAWLPVPYFRTTVPIAAPTVELTIHFRTRRFAPEPAPVLGVFTSRRSTEGFFEEDGELWSQDGVLLAQSRQLALARPL